MEGDGDIDGGSNGSNDSNDGRGRKLHVCLRVSRGIDFFSKLILK
jgi:hypothetical protein